MITKKVVIYCATTFLIFGCSLLKGKNKIIIESNYEVADKYAAYIDKEDLKKHLTIIASDEYEGRETAMPGQKKAAAYIENQFILNGLEPGLGKDGYQQSFPVVLKDPSKVSLQIDATKFKFLEDFYYLGSVTDTIHSKKNIIYLGYGIDQEGISDYNGIDVSGKFILIREGIPLNRDDIKFEWSNWRNKQAAAIKHGAIGIITIQEDFESKVEKIKVFIENPTMQMHNTGNKSNVSIPNIYMNSKSIERWIDLEKLETSNLSNLVSIQLKTRQILNSENILGFIEGTDLKDEIVVITAHYDHIGYDNGEVCNGADDDGSGTVAVIELSQAFAVAKREGNGPRRSMLFMTVSGEEKGLFGSAYYSENPVYPLNNTVVDLNIDMIGRQDSLHTNDNYVYLIGANRLSMDLHNISKKVNIDKINMELDYTYNDPKDPNFFYYRSDHYNFAKNDIPVIFYFSGIHADYHKPTDDVEKINFPKLEKTARLVFYTAWEIANRTDRLELNGIEK
jgi:hypothetical protein